MTRRIAVLTIALAPCLAPQTQEFRFRKEQAVYVVAVQGASRDLNVTSADLGLERSAKDQFKREKKFKLAKTLGDADFVFFILIDGSSRDFDEVALVVLPLDYLEHGQSLDSLRARAVWQEASHLKRGRHAALAGATIGLSVIFDRPSVSKGLVKKFHQDVGLR